MIQEEARDNKDNSPNPEVRPPSHEGEPVSFGKGTGEQKITERPKQIKSHGQPEEKAKSWRWFLKKVLDQPRSTSAGEVSCRAAQIEDVATASSSFPAFGSQSRPVLAPPPVSRPYEG